MFIDSLDFLVMTERGTLCGWNDFFVGGCLCVWGAGRTALARASALESRHTQLLLPSFLAIQPTRARVYCTDFRSLWNVPALTPIVTYVRSASLPRVGGAPAAWPVLGGSLSGLGRPRPRPSRVPLCGGTLPRAPWGPGSPPWGLAPLLTPRRRILSSIASFSFLVARLRRPVLGIRSCATGSARPPSVPPSVCSPISVSLSCASSSPSLRVSWHVSAWVHAVSCRCGYPATHACLANRVSRLEGRAQQRASHLQATP